MMKASIEAFVPSFLLRVDFAGFERWALDWDGYTSDFVMNNYSLQSHAALTQSLQSSAFEDI